MAVILPLETVIVTRSVPYLWVMVLPGYVPLFRLVPVAGLVVPVAGGVTTCEGVDVAGSADSGVGLGSICRSEVGGSVDGLGPLEAAVMDVLWRTAEPVRVRVVLQALGPQRELAYTTVMTVLDNLHRKGWVVRERDRNAYRYQPARSRAAAAALGMRRLLDSTGDPEAVLLHFARSASEAELGALRAALEDRDGPP